MGQSFQDILHSRSTTKVTSTFQVSANGAVLFNSSLTTKRYSMFRWIYNCQNPPSSASLQEGNDKKGRYVHFLHRHQPTVPKRASSSLGINVTKCLESLKLCIEPVLQRQNAGSQNQPRPATSSPLCKSNIQVFLPEY